MMTSKAVAITLLVLIAIGAFGTSAITFLGQLMNPAPTPENDQHRVFYGGLLTMLAAIVLIVALAEAI